MAAWELSHEGSFKRTRRRDSCFLWLLLLWMHYGGRSEATCLQTIPRRQLGKGMSPEPGPSFLTQDLFNGPFWPGAPHWAGGDFLRTSLSSRVLLTPLLLLSAPHSRSRQQACVLSPFTLHIAYTSHPILASTSWRTPTDDSSIRRAPRKPARSWGFRAGPLIAHLTKRTLS